MPKVKGETPKSDERPAWRHAETPAPKRPAVTPRRKRARTPAEGYEHQRHLAQEAADIIREVREEEEEW